MKRLNKSQIKTVLDCNINEILKRIDFIHNNYDNLSDKGKDQVIKNLQTCIVRLHEHAKKGGM